MRSEPPQLPGPVRPLRRQDLTVYELDGELLVFDPRNSDTHRLNATAHSIWRWCDGQTEPEEMAARMTTAYEVELPEALEHVHRLLGELQGHGLVVNEHVPA